MVNINIEELFPEYSNKNIALIMIEINKSGRETIYIKTKIQGKKISKSLNFKNKNLTNEKLYNKIITDSKIELINIVKSKNLIDIRTPSFLNVKFAINKKSNLVELNSRIKNIDLIENIYVQKISIKIT